MLTLILPIVFGILSIISFVLFIMVLVKLFKNEGILKGILGILCGIYTFVWGWIKHKQLKLTKLMAVWTLTIVLFLVLQFVLMTAGIFSAMDMMRTAQPPQHPPVVQKPVKRPGPEATKTVPAAQAPAKKPEIQVATKPPVPAAKPSPGIIPKPQVNMDYEAEMKKINDLVQQNDKNADALYNRGWLYAYKGDLEMAEKDYTRAVGIKPGFESALFNRGLVRIQMMKYDQAIEDFSQVLNLNPGAGDAYCNRGNAHLKLGKVELAIQDFEVAIEMNPKDGDLYLNRAIAYQTKGEAQKAKADFEKASAFGNSEAKKYLEGSAVKSGSPATPVSPSPMKE